jgi:hypothetical protein
LQSVVVVAVATRLEQDIQEDQVDQVVVVELENLMQVLVSQEWALEVKDIAEAVAKL